MEKVIFAGSKSARERYGNFICYYRFTSPNEFVLPDDFLSVPGNIIKEDPPRSLTVQFIIPATSLEKGQKLEYKLSSELDGHENIIKKTIEQK